MPDSTAETRITPPHGISSAGMKSPALVPGAVISRTRELVHFSDPDGTSE
jgi:hypothetical protein